MIDSVFGLKEMEERRSKCKIICLIVWYMFTNKVHLQYSTVCMMHVHVYCTGTQVFFASLLHF